MKSGEEFRGRVFNLVREMFPKVEVRIPDSSPDVIVSGKTDIGLQSLRANFEQSDQEESTLREMVRHHFSILLNDKFELPDFAEASPKLRPQIIPPNFVKRIPLLIFQFATSLETGIVVDSDQSYIYVTREAAAKWGKTPDELFKLALLNLEKASENLPMTGSENGEMKFVALDTHDGFDAARILLPDLRGFVGQRIGLPFYFAVPNRDFLICWKGPAEFTASVRAKVKDDFEKRPYPISPHYFEVTADGDIIEYSSTESP